MIKAVIFDFFGVLSTEGFTLFCDTYFADNREKRQQAVDLVTKHDVGAVTKSQYVSGLAALADVSPDVVVEHMRRNKPNKLLIDYIRQEIKPKYKTGILSNAGDDYISQILDPADVQLFDDIVLSYQHGVVKPQAAIFELAAHRLALSVNECVFVDDSPSHCEGARRAGMQAVQYENFTQLRSDFYKVLSAGADN